MSRFSPSRRIPSVEDESTGHVMDYQSFSETTVPTTRPAGLNLDSANSPEDRMVALEQVPTTESSSNPTNALLYRGFSTSINDLFVESQYERSDCCAITCCGILQHDRDRFLLTGIQPPSLLKRFLVHVVIPGSIFLAAGIGAMRIPDVVANEIISTSLLLAFVFYLLLQCSKGRAKRMDIRKDLLFTKYQIQQQHVLSDEPRPGQYRAVLLEQERPVDGRDGGGERVYYMGQSRRDMGGAHPCCLLGCYAEDRPKNLLRSSNEDNVCSCMFDYVCPPYCGSYIQCCGMCAIAQEARDIETCILPAPYRRIDYITMEAILKYYPAIYQHRHHGASAPILSTPEETTSTTAQPPRRTALFLGHPLSLLSHRLLQFLLFFWVLLLIWSYVGTYYYTYILGRRGHRQHQFQIFDCVLMLFTFLQSFALLGVWTYFVNRIKSSELSLDAMIKYFASGFFLSASLALFWEVLASAIINTFVSLLLAILGVDRVGDPQSDHTGSASFGAVSFLPTLTSRPTLLSRMYGYSSMDDPMSVKRPDYATVFGMDHPFLYTIYILFATFIVAGFIEELCKYFGYRMVEHPDFFTRDELEEASMILQSSSYVDEDEGEVVQQRSDRTERLQPAVVNFSKQGQSIQARGAAITLAMVSVAIGFACCENLIYIFFYAGSSFTMELGVLLMRSCFPVHPILAAIQSIRVCERDLEGSRSMKLGRIILPAVLFHGTFDFFIVFISFIGRLVGQGVEDGDLRISNTTEFLSVVSCVVIMFITLMYLYNESGRQRERLAALDFESTVDRSSLI